MIESDRMLGWRFNLLFCQGMMNSKRFLCPEFLAQKKTLRIGTPSKSIKLNVILAYPIDIHIYIYIYVYIDAYIDTSDMP
jgi:hypothetical protein